MTKTYWLAAAGVLALSAPIAASAETVAPAAAPAAAKPAIGTWGVDLAGRDLAVKPGDDFQRHTAGLWLDATQIPSDRASIGAFYDLREATQSQLQKLITESPAGSKYGALYASYMDEAGAEARGLAPLKADLAAVSAIRTKADFARFMGTTAGTFGISLFAFSADADPANPTMNVLWLGQDGIGLPEREYYFADQFKPQREAYRAYIERTMAAIGHAKPAEAAATILAFETSVAESSWKIADRRDIEKLNNPMSTAQLVAYAPGFDWTAYFAGPASRRRTASSSTKTLRSATWPPCTRRRRWQR